MTAVAASTVAERTGVSAELLTVNPNTNEIAISGFDDPAGHLIAGITYRCDYAAEQECGIGDLRKTITSPNPRQFVMDPSARRYICLFSDVNGFAVSTSPLPATARWGDELPSAPANRYAHDWSRRLDWSLDRATGCSRSSLEYRKMPQLVEMATERGVVAPHRTKAALVDALLDDARTKFGPNLGCAPAWFEYGRTMVVRADTGVLADVVAALRDAIEAGTFGIGSASSAFSSGILFYDTRDESEQLRTEREARFDWIDARMDELEPVKAELRSLGISWYFLGKPRESSDGTIRYWLNGSGSPQPCGWYTLDELRALKFVDDAEARVAARR